jgi:hypothetical protein
LNETLDQEAPAKRADEPAPRPQLIPKQAAPTADPSSKEHKPRQSYTLDRALVRWTRVVGIFTVVLAAVGGIQAWAFIQSERASVFFQLLRVVPMPLVADTPLTIKIILANDGPAQAFVSEAKVKGWIGNLADKPNYSDITYAARAFIPAHGTRFLDIGPVKPALNWAQVDDVTKGRVPLYIFGYLKYTDDFSIFGPKTIGFCAVFDPHNNISGSGFNECENPNYVYRH